MTYCPSQETEPETGPEPCGFCGGDCSSYDECEAYAEANARDEAALVESGQSGTDGVWWTDDEKGAPF